MDKIKVSVIMGIYNAERTLRDCLNAIVSQDYSEENRELIITDGGSTDSTLAIVKEFMGRYKNIRLMHNPGKLAEGIGMSKDMGVNNAKGEIVVFLDHDNIISGKKWLSDIVFPFDDDPKVMASQSLLTYEKKDTIFLKYINAIGVEDPFAPPFSLVSKVQFYPEKFRLIKNKYYLYDLPKKNILFAGSNGCAYRKHVFKTIGGHTRDLDIFTSMSEFGMRIAIPKDVKLVHRTASTFLTYMKKKGIYFHRLLDEEYESRKYRWIEPNLSDRTKFAIMVLGNLSIIIPLAEYVPLAIKRKEAFLMLHPFYLFYVTWVYGFITLFKFSRFLKYATKEE